MSTLKTNNIEHLDASTPSIQTTIGGGTILAGVTTVSDALSVGTGTSISSPATNTLALGTNDAERVRIDSSGDVLVNHTSSLGGGSGKLQSYTNSSDSIDILAYSSTATNGGRLTFYRSKNNTIGNSSEVANGDSLGRIDWRGYNDDGASNNLGAIIEAVVSGDIDSTTDMPSDFLFKTSSNGSSSPTERLRITSAGNVGINTTAPDKLLTVFTDSSSGYSTATNNTPSGQSLIKLFNKNGTDNTGVDNYSAIEFGVANGATSQGWLGYTRTGNNQGAFFVKQRNASSSYPETIRFPSSGGVTFGGGANTANTLDDYEEGTWTPTLGGTATYSTQQGFYTKIGNIVTVTFYLVVSAIGTGSNRIVAGLPYSATNSTGGGPVAYWNNTSQNMVYCSMYSYNNNSLAGYIATSAVSSLTTGSIFQTGTALQACIQYRAA